MLYCNYVAFQAGSVIQNFQDQVIVVVPLNFISFVNCGFYIINYVYKVQHLKMVFFRGKSSNASIMDRKRKINS